MVDAVSESVNTTRPRYERDTQKPDTGRPCSGSNENNNEEVQPRRASSIHPFPGNINQLLFQLKGYTDTLERTKGVMPEFVNPKYKDAEKTVFKKPTRLECMMQVCVFLVIVQQFLACDQNSYWIFNLIRCYFMRCHFCRTSQLC